VTLPGLSRYVVGHLGAIFRRTRDGVLVPMATRLNDEGYPKIKLVGDDGRRRDYFVHLLVARAYLPTPAEGQTQVCHKNGCRTDCAQHNLRWGTRADNHADKREHGTHNRGAVRKLSPKDVRNIRRATSGAAKIAKRWGLAISHVRNIRSRKRHK